MALNKYEREDFEASPYNITYETPEVLNILDSTVDRERYAILKNKEEQGEIEILHETKVESPRQITKDGDEFPAEYKIIIHYVTISKGLYEDDTSTELS